MKFCRLFVLCCYLIVSCLPPLSQPYKVVRFRNNDVFRDSFENKFMSGSRSSAANFLKNIADTKITIKNSVYINTGGRRSAEGSNDVSSSDFVSGGIGEILANGACHYFSEKKATWPVAMKKCGEQGLCLACLRRSGAMKQVFSYLRQHHILREYWIGLSESKSGDFKYLCENRTVSFLPPHSVLDPDFPYGYITFGSYDDFVIKSANRFREKHYICAHEGVCIDHSIGLPDVSGNGNGNENGKGKNKGSVIIKCDCGNIGYKRIRKSPAAHKYVLTNVSAFTRSMTPGSTIYIVSCDCSQTSKNVNINIDGSKGLKEKDLERIIGEIMTRTHLKPKKTTRTVDIEKYKCGD